MSTDEHFTAMLSALRLPCATEEEARLRFDAFSAAATTFAESMTREQRRAAADALLLAHNLHTSFPCDGNFPLRLGILTGAMLK